MKVKKPAAFVENDLSRNKLYNILVNRRVKGMTREDMSLHLRLLVWQTRLRAFMFRVVSWVVSRLAGTLCGTSAE